MEQNTGQFVQFVEHERVVEGSDSCDQIAESEPPQCLEEAVVKPVEEEPVQKECVGVVAEIQKKVDDGIITKEEGLEYTHMVKTRTDDLIGMKVLPKKIVTETNQVENKKLLTEFEGLKLISGKE